MKVNLPGGRTIVGVKVSGLAHEGPPTRMPGAGRIKSLRERRLKDARAFHSEDAALKLASIQNSLRAIETPTLISGDRMKPI